MDIETRKKFEQMRDQMECFANNIDAKIFERIVEKGYSEIDEENIIFDFRGDENKRVKVRKTEIESVKKVKHWRIGECYKIRFHSGLDIEGTNIKGWDLIDNHKTELE